MLRGRITLRLWLGIVSVLCACSPPAPPANRSGLEVVTPVTTLDTGNLALQCETVENAEAGDWPLVIRALEALREHAADCPGQESTTDQLYNAYIQYATLLENQHQREEAITLYQSALQLQPGGEKAVEALTRLNQLPRTVRSLDCEADTPANEQRSIPPYRPSQGAFVEINGRQFVLNSQPFPLYGIDYYPRDTPWRRLLTETDIETVNSELGLLRQVGLNSLRLRLRHDLLFECGGKTSVPIADNIMRLDSIIQATAAQGFHVMLVLNDALDLTDALLYDSPRYNVEQMVYLAERYRDEPAILAWDLREGADLDYRYGQLERRAVTEWLAETAILMRQVDPNHLITAGWTQDSETTIPVVDFVSFTSSGDLSTLRQQIAILTGATAKPIVLSSIGYHTFGNSEEGQRDSLQAALDAVRHNQLAGWFVWTAFDFPLTATCYEPGCVNQDSPDHHFGLWTTEYQPKLVVGVIEIATGIK